MVWHSTEDIEFLECDRVLVFSGGRIVRELVGPEITEQAIVDASFAGAGALERDGTAGARGLADWLVDLAPFASLAAVFALMAWVNPLTVSMFGLELLLGPAIALVLVALAQMFVVGGSEIDLGVGAFAGLVNVLSATLLVDTPWLGVLALVAGVLAYGLIGATIQLRRIPAIVVTLGASFIWIGIGYTLQPTPGGAAPEWLSAAFAWTIAEVPATLILIAVAGLVALAIDRSPLGVVLRGFGNNAQAMTLGGWSPLRYAVVRYMVAEPVRAGGRPVPHRHQHGERRQCRRPLHAHQRGRRGDGRLRADRRDDLAARRGGRRAHPRPRRRAARRSQRVDRLQRRGAGLPAAGHAGAARLRRTPGGPPMSALLERLERHRWVWSALGVLILWAILSATTGRFSLHSLSGVAVSASFLTLVALGQMLVVTTGRGNIDLSIASVLTLSAYASIIVAAGADARLPLALAAVVGIGPGHRRGECAAGGAVPHPGDHRHAGDGLHPRHRHADRQSLGGRASP